MNPCEFSKFLIDAEDLRKREPSIKKIIRILAKKYNCNADSLRSRGKYSEKRSRKIMTTYCSPFKKGLMERKVKFNRY